MSDDELVTDELSVLLVVELSAAKAVDPMIIEPTRTAAITDVIFLLNRVGQFVLEERFFLYP